MIFNKGIEQHTQALADYLPNDITFEAKNVYDSNFRRLLRGLAGEYRTAQGYIATLENEYLPDLTTLFIDEWERYLGIPDGCFTGTGTLEERRRDVLVKFASSGVQTADDFVKLAAIFGVAVSVTAGIESIMFPLTFPSLMFSTESDARYTIVVQFTVDDSSRFPLTFPIIFGTDLIAILECLFRRLKPDNCNIIFQQI